MENLIENDEFENLKVLFDGFEEKHCTYIPKNIKKTLNMMEYSQFMISAADPEVLIQELEETIKTVLPSFIDVKETEIYFGKLYRNCPDKFKFFTGHKTLIRDLVKYAFLTEKGRNKAVKESRVLLGKKRKREGSTEKDDDLEEIENCKSLVSKWFKTKLNVDIVCKVSSLKTTDQEIQVSIQCPLCSSKYRCHKIKNQTEQGWFLSNLYRHANVMHIEKTETATTQSIYSFLAVSPPQRKLDVNERSGNEIEIISSEQLTRPDENEPGNNQDGSNF